MSCPFLESENPHCSSVLSLAHIREALEFCLDQWNQCPIYLELTGAMAGSLATAGLER